MNPGADIVEEIRIADGETPLKTVGDCIKAQDVAHAIRTAYIAAMEIG